VGDCVGSRNVKHRLEPQLHATSAKLFCPVLRLRTYEVIRHDKTLCGERDTVLPYSELGSIETGLFCCFVCVDSNLGTIIPSFGCDRDAVECIVKELNARVVNRGDAAQLGISKQIIAKVDSIDKKMDCIVKHLADNQCQQHSSPPSLTIEER
jgi:hypothetical protein